MEKRNHCAVVIPAYREHPTPSEKKSLDRTADILNHRALYLLVPEDLPTDWYSSRYPHITIQRYPPSCFSGFSSYNRWMLSADFYEEWLRLGFEWILICQLDVYVFSDMLDVFLKEHYAYWGGPMLRVSKGRPELYGGNGGFSLRNLKAMARVLREGRKEVQAWTGHEDEFFSEYGRKHPDVLPIPAPNISARFAYDRFLRYLHGALGSLPFAMHSFERHDPEYGAYLADCAANPDAPPFCETWERDAALREFLSKGGDLYLYGIGMWGHSFLTYMQRHQWEVAGFVVSDRKDARGGCFYGHPVFSLIDFSKQARTRKVKVLIAFSMMYWGQKERENFHHMLTKIGVQAVFEPNACLLNMIGEEWMFERNKAENTKGDACF